MVSVFVIYYYVNFLTGSLGNHKILKYVIYGCVISFNNSTLRCNYS